MFVAVTYIRHRRNTQGWTTRAAYASDTKVSGASEGYSQSQGDERRQAAVSGANHNDAPLSSNTSCREDDEERLRRQVGRLAAPQL